MRENCRLAAVMEITTPFCSPPGRLSASEAAQTVDRQDVSADLL
jgi:hypothetical protein